MNSIEYLDAVRVERGLSSDYALAKSLQITRTAVSNIRLGKAYLGVETSIKVAEILGIHPAVVIADCSAERAKSDVIRNVWLDISAKFPGLSLSKLHNGKSAANPRHA